jgi:2-polyprenyl-6-hydroxyphenyl methylase / 3-demethylubiquinone-9 3-methyltransferase
VRSYRADNAIYDRMADSWWDPDSPLHFLRTAVNPARFGYFRDVLIHRLGIAPMGRPALDVGCGGGLLAEEFAQLGCRVTGIDPSRPSIDVAKAHAGRMGLEITYMVAAGEAIPFKDRSFDIVYCCDVLEHVRDVTRVIGEIARVLTPGGIYFYDTINRTLWSNLLMIKFLQDWEWSRLLPCDLHDWSMFIKPRELHALMGEYGVANRETAGMSPSGNLFGLIYNIRRFKRGRIPLGELARRLRLKASKDTSASYMGYAIKLGGSTEA